MNQELKTLHRSMSGNGPVARPGYCNCATTGLRAVYSGHVQRLTASSVLWYPRAAKYDTEGFGFPVRAKDAHMSWIIVVCSMSRTLRTGWSNMW
jgi:hypothetical protein